EPGDGLERLLAQHALVDEPHSDRPLGRCTVRTSCPLPAALGQPGCRGQAHRSTPLRHAYTSPSARIPMNTIIEIRACTPSCSSWIAHGKMNTASTSNMTNR